MRPIRSRYTSSPVQPCSSCRCASRYRPRRPPAFTKQTNGAQGSDPPPEAVFITSSAWKNIANTGVFRPFRGPKRLEILLLRCFSSLFAPLRATRSWTSCGYCLRSPPGRLSRSPRSAAGRTPLATSRHHLGLIFEEIHQKRPFELRFLLFKKKFRRPRGAPALVGHHSNATPWDPGVSCQSSRSDTLIPPKNRCILDTLKIIMVSSLLLCCF